MSDMSEQSWVALKGYEAWTPEEQEESNRRTAEWQAQRDKRMADEPEEEQYVSPEVRAAQMEYEAIVDRTVQRPVPPQEVVDESIRRRIEAVERLGDVDPKLIARFGNQTITVVSQVV